MLWGKSSEYGVYVLYSLAFYVAFDSIETFNHGSLEYHRISKTVVSVLLTISL